jgi:DNA-binding response OmpR family regulator
MDMRILIVEQDAAYQRALADCMKDFRCDIVCASRFDAALEMVRENPFDIAIVEFYGDTDTADLLCQELKRDRGRDTDLILTCSKQSFDIERRARGFSPVVFLVKPYDIGDIAATVSRILKQKFERMKNWGH